MDKNTVKAVDIMGSITYATIATCDSTLSPWNTPVYFAYDASGSIYWSSHTEARHTLNINATGKAFIVIYDSTSPAGDGLFLNCIVETLENRDDIAAGLKVLGKRRGRPFKHLEKFMDDGPQRIFKATPSEIWINDADKDADGDFIKDYRIKVNLNSFQDSLK